MAGVNPTVVRTLNYLRMVHLPTYVALRLMLKSVPSSELDAFVESVISQVTIRKSARTLELRRFKSKCEAKFVYRNYSVPSPTTALADSYAISVIHASEVVRRRDYVYSYRSPRQGGYQKNFEHFSIGYRERNEAISKALEDERMVAVIVDIRNFYPTVDAFSSIDALRARLNGARISGRDRAVVLACAERASSSSDSGVKAGLRVGPEMSHVLADISLEKIDSKLYGIFGKRFFRYVDDIVAVVPRQEAAKARAIIAETLNERGHSISDEKDAVVDGKEWLGHRMVGQRFTSDASIAINWLKFRVKLFLAKRPLEVNALKAALRDAGVHLPIDQLLDASQQKAWRHRASSLFSQGWKVVASYWVDTLEDIVFAARECQKKVGREVDEILAAGDVVGSDVSRKWGIQCARMSINRALYFSSDEQLRNLRDYALRVPELAETAAVCMALLGDASQVVKMPGPAVSAFSQIASIRGMEFPDLKNFRGSGENDIIADVAAHFSLRSDSSFCDSPDVSADLNGLAAFASGLNGVLSAASGQGYGAEVAALAINSSRRERMDAALTRFSFAEEVVLDALNLSANYVS